ncbi:hypothetical protein HU200_032657 [Digitaria exilis]|uniref:Glycosyl transferase CAP10 domain-containing protein n=1 Tax=Digitaria exilis TaxID=1010633 RepID=A0A835ES33_9POAL|nr:hypothetical protein HU200_032657 [Digitaria exilis]
MNGGVYAFFAALVAGALVSACWMSASARVQVAPITPVATPTIAHYASTGPEQAPGPPRFTGVGTSRNQTPSTAVPLPPPAPSPSGAASPSSRDCPAYFQWIHEDLRPWHHTGITLDAVEGARRRYAPKFRVTVVSGRLYVARYGRRCFQTRDVFTQWGHPPAAPPIPGTRPGPRPHVRLRGSARLVRAADSHHHAQQPPSPLFRYCGSETTLDIAFPDWSFWGWPELSIKPWDAVRREIEEGNAMENWTDGEPERRRRTPAPPQVQRVRRA